MSEMKANLDQLCKDQATVAFRRLQDALLEHVKDVNMRLQAGLVVRKTQTAIEVHELEKPDALLHLSLTRENHINYTQLVKRHNEMQSGVLYVGTSQDGSPILLFSDFPHPNEQVSYREASRRLLNSSF